MLLLFRCAKLIQVFIFLLLSISSQCQLQYNLKDGRTDKYCINCANTITSKPNEVLFGINVNEAGDIYFSMNDKVWFDKIFRSDAYGVAADIVVKDKYQCANAATDMSFALLKGTMTPPVYRAQLMKESNELMKGAIYTKIGKLPSSLIGKELEGNLVILNGDLVCYYTNFINIDRNEWELLSMGLYTDSLLQNLATDKEKSRSYFAYSKQVQINVPFAKGSSVFSDSYLKGLYDSLQLDRFRIRGIEMRAYSSVEGSEKINMSLMNKRANAMLDALKPYGIALTQTKIISAENWVDFFNDIEKTSFSNMRSKSKLEIKQKLTDPAVAKAIEPILAKQRKVMVVFYMDTKTALSIVNDTSLSTSFIDAIKNRNINLARSIQKEFAERIADGKLPPDYLNELDIPVEKGYSDLLSDREVYNYLLQLTSEAEALKSFIALQKLDPANGHISYNVCALRFFLWRHSNEKTGNTQFLNDINTLDKQGISPILVKRMLINYYILKGEDQLRAYNYNGKDSSIAMIREIYKDIHFSDADIFSMAKYYARYAQQDWAEEIVAPRINQADVSEDLVFYYLNLLFFKPVSYQAVDFDKALLNARNINKRRFCSLFLPNDKGGASMQLLDYGKIRSAYCDVCK